MATQAELAERSAMNRRRGRDEYWSGLPCPASTGARRSAWITAWEDAGSPEDRRPGPPRHSEPQPRTIVNDPTMAALAAEVRDRLRAQGRLWTADDITAGRPDPDRFRGPLAVPVYDHRPPAYVTTGDS